jgi:hypothetical protein
MYTIGSFKLTLARWPSTRPFCNTRVRLGGARNHMTMSHDPLVGTFCSRQTVEKLSAVMWPAYPMRWWSEWEAKVECSRNIFVFVWEKPGFSSWRGWHLTIWSTKKIIWRRSVNSLSKVCKIMERQRNYSEQSWKGRLQRQIGPAWKRAGVLLTCARASCLN